MSARCPKCAHVVIRTQHFLLHGAAYFRHACTSCGHVWRRSRHDGLDLELLPTPAGAP